MTTPETFGYAAVNGLSMYYEIYGEGNMPLVLIHGGGSTIESSFGNIIPLLKDYGKVIAMELQAHGRTEDRNTPETFEQDADDVVSLIRHLKIKKAHFLGYSNGGTTTLQIAIRHADIAGKIISISGVYKRDGFIDGFFEGFPEVTVDHMPELLQEAFLKVTPDKDKLHNMFEKDKARMMQFKDIEEELIASINTPALFMVGDQDVVTTKHTLEMSKIVPNAQLVVLPGYHGAFLGDICTVKKGSRYVEITAAIIKEFLNDSSYLPE